MNHNFVGEKILRIFLLCWGKGELFVNSLGKQIHSYIRTYIRTYMCVCVCAKIKVEKISTDWLIFQ